MAKNDKNSQKNEKESALSQISQKFRQRPGVYIGSVIVLVVITILFVFISPLSGVGIFAGGDEVDLTFGYYDGKPVSYVQGNYFARYLAFLMNFYQSREIDISNFSNSAQIYRQAYEEAVKHVAILRVMERSNYYAPEKTVNRQIAKMPEFHVNGKFSNTLWNQLSNATQSRLKRQETDNIVKDAFLGEYYDGLSISSSEAEFIGGMSSVMRSFEMVSFSVEEYSESEFLAYTMENADRFRTVHLSRIIIKSSEREAKRILDSISSGVTTFEDAARSQSQDEVFSDRGGDMGIQFALDLESEIPAAADRDSVYNLRGGEISGVIKIGEQWAFYRAEEAIRPADFNDYSTLEKARSYLKNYDRGRMEDWAMAKATEFSADADASGFYEAARSWNLERKIFGPLPINYGGVGFFTSLQSFNISGFSQQDKENLSQNENFWKAAFATQLNSPSRPFVQGNNVIVLFPTEQIYSDVSSMEKTALSYSSKWVNDDFEQSLPQYFLNNSRMKDRFWDAFFHNYKP